jgi:23S rRNA (uridine2552-2'-O)-methyltransferase
MSRRSGSSDRWRRRQDADPYVERAAREGWRSRAVFKLQQIQQKERVLSPGLVCVDLGASPGGWSQLAARIVGSRGAVIAVDLLPMTPIPGVEFVVGDFQDPGILTEVEARLRGRPVGLVMSDMAPNISGTKAVDQPRSMALAEDALAFAEAVLAPGGSLLVKLFQGEGFDDFVSHVRDKFRRVRLIKPKASRPASREIYLLARNYGM